VVLMAPDATTHGTDMQQRHLSLHARQTRKGLVATAPSRHGAAPPGYYMVFILNKKGEPSVAKWIRIGHFPSRKKGKRRK
jgi:hypothetical protein